MRGQLNNATAFAAFLSMSLARDSGRVDDGERGGGGSLELTELARPRLRGRVLLISLRGPLYLSKRIDMPG